MSSHLLLESHLGFNFLVLCLDIGMICRQLSQSGEILQALLRLATIYQISRSLWDEWNHQAHHCSGNQLYTHCKPPLGIVVLRVVPKADTVIDPECKGQAKDNHEIIGSGH